MRDDKERLKQLERKAKLWDRENARTYFLLRLTHCSY